MKKILSLLFGCMAALVIAVSFSACNPKDKNNASVEDAMIGTWQGVINNLSYMLTINSTHTGSVVVNNGNNGQATFIWSMFGEDVVMLVITSGQLPGLEDLGNTLTMKVSFPGSNQLLFTLTTPPYSNFGPFVKTSGSGQQGGQSQQGGQPTSQIAITMANLAGDWQLTGYRSSEDSNFSIWTSTPTTITLTSNGGYTSTGYLGNGSGTYTLAGTYVTVYATGSPSPLAYFSVISLTNDELILQMENDYYFKFNRIQD